MYYYTYLVIPTNENSRLFGTVYFGQRKSKLPPEEDINYKGSGIKIQDYYKKHPNDYYKEIIKEYSSEEELNKAEFDLVHLYLGKNWCLNLREGGDYFPNYTFEVRQKMSKTRKERIKSGDIITWNKGLSWGEETRKKISEGQKGRIPWNKGKHNVQDKYWLGKHHSDKTKKKISETKKLYHISPSNKGKHKVWDNKELNIYHFE